MQEPSSSGSRRRGRGAAPGFVKPLLPTLVAEPPEGEQWEHEIKHDGYRAQILVDRADGRVFTRNGHDWSDRFGPVLAAAQGLACRSAQLDGEMVVQDEDGRSDFAAFQSDVQSGRPDRMVFFAFDLLEVDGEDLRSQPLSVRRARLRELVGHPGGASRVWFSESLAGSGREIFAAACSMGLEGIVSKKLNSRYRSGRQSTWLKAKCFEEDEFTIIGADHEPGKPAFALLAREGPTGLVYAGSAFLVLAGEERDLFWRFVESHAVDRPAVDLPSARKAAWVEPRLRALVQYLKGGEKLRHGSLRELRPSIERQQ